MTATLRAESRPDKGTRPSRKLRAKGQIPASLQGAGGPTLEFSITADVFLGLRRAHAHLFEIETGSGQPQLALVRELQWDALGEQILHVEFRRVVRGQVTQAQVELEFAGQPKGGILNHLVTHLRVLAEPQDIPDSIPVDVSAMELGKPLYARDLVLPAKVKLDLPPETIIAVVVLFKEEKVAEPVAEVAEAAAAVPGAAAPAAGAAPGAAAPAGGKGAAAPGAKGAGPAGGKGAPPEKGGDKK